MIHRIAYTSKYGAAQVGRVYGAPDRDSAAIWIANQYPGCVVRTAEAIGEGEPRMWGEHDLGRFHK
jgi:hypothetical protein